MNIVVRGVQSSFPGVRHRWDVTTRLLGIASLVLSCGESATGGSSTTESQLESSGEGAPTSSGATSLGAGSTESSGSTSAGTLAESSGELSSTGEPLPLTEACRLAESEEACAAIDDWCKWHPSYRVLDLETCTLEEPVPSCWATDPTGPQGCFDGVPLVCQSMDLRPLFRQVDDVLYVLNVDGACQSNPIAPEGEPQWIECKGEKFMDVPDVCYCLCGGVPDDTSSTG